MWNESYFAHMQNINKHEGGIMNVQMQWKPRTWKIAFKGSMLLRGDGWGGGAWNPIRVIVLNYNKSYKKNKVSLSGRLVDGRQLCGGG